MWMQGFQVLVQYFALVWWRETPEVAAFGGYRRKYLGRPQPLEGEAIEVLQGVQEACARQWSRVIVETDCL